MTSNNKYCTYFLTQQGVAGLAGLPHTQQACYQSYSADDIIQACKVMGLDAYAIDNIKGNGSNYCFSKGAMGQVGEDGIGCFQSGWCGE